MLVQQRCPCRRFRVRFRCHSEAALLTTAVDQRFEIVINPISEIQRTDALGAVELVTAQTRHVQPDLFDSQWKLPSGLDGVRVNEDIVVVTNCRYFIDRLDHPSFVVCMHDRDQHRLGANGILNVSGINSTVIPRWYPRNVDPTSFEPVAGFFARGMFDRRCYDVSAVSSGHDILESEVVRFAPTAREDD